MTAGRKRLTTDDSRDAGRKGLKKFDKTEFITFLREDFGSEYVNENLDSW